MNYLMRRKHIHICLFKSSINNLNGLSNLTLYNKQNYNSRNFSEANYTFTNVKDTCFELDDEGYKSNLIKIFHNLSNHDRNLYIWSLNLKRDYKTVIEAMKSVLKQPESQESYEIIAGTMFAYAKLGDYEKVLELHDFINIRSSLSINSFLQSCCNADKHIVAETILKHWLKLFVTNNSTVIARKTNSLLGYYRLDTTEIADKLLEQSSDQDSKRPHFSSISDNKPLQIFNNLCQDINISLELPDMESWITIMNMYCKRKAWVECLQIVDYLEEITQDREELSCFKPEVWYLSDTTKKLLEYKCDLIQESLYKLNSYSIKVLCASYQYTTALDLIHNLKAKGYEVQPVTIAPLLDIFYGPCSGVNLFDADQSNNRLFAMIDLTKVIAKVIGEIEYSTRKTQVSNNRNSDHANKYYNRWIDQKYLDILNDFDQRKLIFEALPYWVDTIVRVLCKRGFVQQAEVFVEEIEEIEKKCDIVILNNMLGENVVSNSFTYAHPIYSLHHVRMKDVASRLQYKGQLIEAYCEAGKWKKAVDLFDQHQDRVLSGSCHEELDEMIYHRIAKAIRKAGQLAELISFMIRYSKSSSKMPPKYNDIK